MSRRQEPRTLDTGRVSLAMRARQKGDSRYPFIRRVAGRRRPVLFVALIAVLLALLAVVLVVLR